MVDEVKTGLRSLAPGGESFEEVVDPGLGKVGSVLALLDAEAYLPIILDAAARIYIEIMRATLYFAC